MASRFPPEVSAFLDRHLPEGTAMAADYIKMDAAWPLARRFQERGWPVRYVRPMSQEQMESQRDYLQLEVWRTQPQFCPPFLGKFLDEFLPGWRLPYEQRPGMPLSERVLARGAGAGAVTRSGVA